MRHGFPDGLRGLRRIVFQLRAAISVRAHDRRVFSRTRPFLGGAPLRREGGRLLGRLRTRTRRLQRPLRHALEAVRDSARRLCALPRRRFGGEHPGHRGAGKKMGEAEKRTAFLPSTCGQPFADRGRRPDRQFPARDRHLLHDLHGLWAAGDDAAHRRDPAGERGRGGGLSAGRPGAVDRRARGREFRRDAAHREREPGRAACASSCSAARARKR
jgi:hypothetical protein